MAKYFLLLAAFVLPLTVYAQDKEFSPLIDRLTEEGINREYVESVYREEEVRFSPEYVLSNFTIKEGKLNYRQFLTPKVVKRCRKYLIDHKESLEFMYNKYHVPPEIVVAVIMVETRLGDYTGGNRVVNVLSTFSVAGDPSVTASLYKRLSPAEQKEYPFDRFQQYCERKSKWAYEQLKAFLRYTRETEKAAHEVTGSIAGAIGYSQFLPSNITLYGRDGDGDGTVDLFTHPDAHASIGKFLQAHGWRGNLTKEQKKKVLFQYNRSKPYVNSVLALAEKIKQ